MESEVEVVEADVRGSAAQAAMSAYFTELAARFDSGFEPERGGADLDAAAMGPPGGTFLVVTSNDQTIGCGGVQRHDPQTAEIKRMWIAADWRGRGLGSRLLSSLEAAARGLGYATVVLDTNSTLREALALYDAAGYESIERYNDNPYAQRWFRKRL